MAENKEKLIRVLQIMEKTDKNSPLNAAQISSKLADEFDLPNVNRSSLYRDFTLLETCGYPIKQCENTRDGWYFEKHAFSDWQVKLMMDIVNQAKCISVEDAEQIHENLLGLVSEKSRSNFSHLISVSSANADDDDTYGEYIRILLDAMFQKKKILFQYSDLDKNLKKKLRKDGKEYELSLYTLYWANNTYYLIGSHDSHEGLTKYRLDRVVNPKISDKPMLNAAEKLGPNPETLIREYINHSVNGYSGNDIRIEIEMEPSDTARGILIDFIGKKNIKIFNKNGKEHASFKKMYTPTLKGFFMQYASMFTVVSPADLRNEIIEELNKALGCYGASNMK